jgi:hypothetical protein
MELDVFVTMSIRFSVLGGGWATVSHKEVITVEEGDTAEDVFWETWNEMIDAPEVREFTTPALISWSIAKNELF